MNGISLEEKYSETKEVKSEILTIMIMDLAGYTKRTAFLPRDEFNELHDIFDALSLPVFKKFEGWVVKKIGDAFLVAFKSATEALHCAIELQNRFIEYNRNCEPKERMHIRVVVNSGEVLIKNNDVYGDAVNTAARVEGIAKAGDIVFTGSTYLAMNKAEIPYMHLGSFKLKGVRNPVRLFKVLRTNKKIMRKEKRKTKIISLICIASMILVMVIILEIFLSKILFPEATKGLLAFLL